MPTQVDLERRANLKQHRRGDLIQSLAAVPYPARFRFKGDETLRLIARELVDTVRRNATIDWTLRESVRANLRRMVRRVLRKHGYPPDKQEKATLTVLKQAEQIAKDWAG